MPSIIIGIFVYGILVLTLGHFSGFAGAVALAIIMLPVVARTTEDMLRLVPDPLRESALAMGAPRWRVILSIVFRAARSGIITGILLGVARVSGETAPLLFTALNSPYMMSSLFQPTPNLTVTIFNYAMSPYEDWQRLAWGASMLITAAVLALNLLARFVFGEKKAMTVTRTQAKTDNDASLIKSAEIAEVIRKQAAHTEAKISTRNLNFFYGENQALFDNNLEIATNRVTAIIGPSGCGKSTHIRVYNRIFEMYGDQQATGEVMLDGQNILTSGHRSFGTAPEGGDDLSKTHALPHEHF